MARLAARKRLLSDLTHWKMRTAAIQASQLRSLFQNASKTDFGGRHGFARLASLPDDQMLRGYRAAVPVADWYVYKDHIARMREGAEPDVLWPGLVRDFAQTSGTTAGDKFIPVSKAMLRSNFLASLDIFANLWRFGLKPSAITGGKSLFLGGSSDVKASDKGIRTGDLSGLVAPLIRWPISQIYLPGREIALMDHWPSKIEAMAQRCVQEDVRMVSGMPSWFLALCERMLRLAKEQGMTSRLDGEAGKPVTTIGQLWPRWQALVHGGVKYTPFEARVRQMFTGSSTGPDVPFRHELYPASEGFIAMQDTRGDPGLRLNVDQMNFFEFVPVEEIDKPGATAHACWEVEKGQKYVVVLSTCAGLWRYILGDVVMFDTIPAKLDGTGGEGPPRLRIVGRHRHFVNAFGENLIVEHIETAAFKAASASGLVIGEFTAAPVYPGAGRKAGLELAVELTTPAQGDQLARFGRAFDESLKAQNVDYTTKRTDDVGMGPPTITPMPLGTFHRWLEAKGKLGGQHKCPRCANSRELLEGVVRAVDPAMRMEIKPQAIAASLR
jgi:GH3 auxin-responsive promoter